MKELLGSILNKVYGNGININLLHFQYLATNELIKVIKKFAPEESGNIVDFGCGNKPYKPFFLKADNYIGVDKADNRNVDFKPDNIFFEKYENSIDVVFSTQVLEHVKELDLLEKVKSLLKDDGKLFISVPFLYHKHDKEDYLRFTEEGLKNILIGYGFKPIKTQKLGGIGSTFTILFLSWIDKMLSKNKLVKLFLYPVFITLSFISNIIGLLLDSIDTTEDYYHTVVVIAEKNG